MRKVILIIKRIPTTPRIVHSIISKFLWFVEPFPESSVLEVDIDIEGAALDAEVSPPYPFEAVPLTSEDTEDAEIVRICADEEDAIEFGIIETVVVCVMGITIELGGTDAEDD